MSFGRRQRVLFAQPLAILHRRFQPDFAVDRLAFDGCLGEHQRQAVALIKCVADPEDADGIFGPALAQLAAESQDPSHVAAADRNIDWVLSHVQPSGWIDGINLSGHPAYLHFIAYVIQGMLECGILRRRDDAIQAAAKSAWVLLRKFETHKRLLGTYQPDFKGDRRFSCLTGNAQMSCIWLRLFEVTGDLRYLNAGLKINEMLKEVLPLTGRHGVRGGVAGSHPIWGRYQPMRFISWGCKFLADALMLEQRLMGALETSECAS